MATEDVHRSTGSAARWADGAPVSVPAMDLLGAALLLSAVCVHLVANLLLLDLAVLRSSTRVVLPCIGVLLIFLSLARRLGSPLWGLVLAYGLLLGLLRLPPMLAQGLFIAAALGAAVYTARTLRIERRHWPALILMALAAAAAVLGVHRAYTSFDMLARLHAGFVHQDTLHHASIAAMIKHYGVVSTGLHGLVVTPYHAFSHHLVAALSVLSGVGVIEVYGVAAWVLFAPLLLFAVAAASFSIPASGPPRAAAAWAVALLVLALAPRLLQRWGVYDTYLNSESYLVALGLFCLSIPHLLKRDLTLADLLLATLLAAMLAHAKATVGLIYAGLWLTRVIFLRGGRRGLDVAALLLTALTVAASVIGAAQANTDYLAFRAFDFIATYTWLGAHIREAAGLMAAGEGIPLATAWMAVLAIASFLALHFLPSWLVLADAAGRAGWRGIFTEPMAIYSLAAVGVGVLVAATLRIPGGSAYFFTQVAFMLSLPAVVAMAVPLVERRDPGARRLLVAALLLVLIANAGALHRISAWGRPYAPVHNPLVAQLLALRLAAPATQVLQPSPAMLAMNPIVPCAAKPFFFPAVSERAWVGVIRSDDAGCRFGFYGYASYGLSPGQPEVRIAPRLLPGMTIADAPADISPQP